MVRDFSMLYTAIQDFVTYQDFITDISSTKFDSKYYGPLFLLYFSFCVSVHLF